MNIATLRRQVARLKKMADTRTRRENPILRDLRADPARLLAWSGLIPDRWQAEILRADAPRTLMLCSRQAGKSTTAAALALKETLLRPDRLVPLVSPSLRQSGELFCDKCLRLFNGLGRPMATTQESALSVAFANGSRIVSLPADPDTIRGYSGVALAIIDEAARVPDELYRTVRPMFAVSRGKLACLSTPHGKMGFFFDLWHGSQPWHRVKVTADMCPRISPEFLAEEREAIGERWYDCEYGCVFMDMIGSLFSHEDIQAALRDDVPVFGLN
jgi:Terminase large subunit, T4likevirus-type, N-terminal